MRLPLTLACVLGVGLLAPSATPPAAAQPRFARLEARLWLGHDTNLLDISDLERRSFETRDPRTLFAVDRLSDQFVQGELGVEWETPRTLTGRPGLGVRWERRQYLHNPIRSEDELRAGLRLRPANRTQADVRAGFRPQVYSRHRYHADALPGEPQFQPEVYRRWDVDVGVRQGLDGRTSLVASLEGSARRYRAPFEERDRETFGGGAGLTRSLGSQLEIRSGARYRATWTRNEPWDPDDRSHRAWRASSGFSFGGVPFLKSVDLDVELEWRRFTSTNSDDQDHFGRRDRGGEVDLRTVHALAGSLDWINRATWRWRRSDFPSPVADEDGPFDGTVVRTGVAWNRKLP